MAAEDEQNDDERGYGAADGGSDGSASDQVDPKHRQPPSQEEAEQDDYANTASGEET